MLVSGQITSCRDTYSQNAHISVVTYEYESGLGDINLTSVGCFNKTFHNFLLGKIVHIVDQVRHLSSINIEKY